MAFKWEDIAELVGGVAPIVGTALGGPAGGAVGSIIAKALGVEDNADAVGMAVKADPSLIVRIKELEFEAHKLDVEAKQKEKQAELDEVNAYLADVQSARNMQVEALKQDDLFSKRYVYYLASFWSVVAMVYIFMITFMTIPEANVRFADTVLGFLLGTIIATVIQYFLGSSKGSADKTAQLSSLAGKSSDA